MVESTGLSRIPDSLRKTLPELPEGLYPLPLSAFEKYLIWDETSQQPMTSFIELHFLDPLQVEVMEQAIAAAMHIHPMFRCTIEERDGNLNWIHQPGFQPRLVMESDHLPLVNSRPIAINLFREPGIRFWYSENHQGCSRVLIQSHHATADGVGLRRFLIDILTLYARATMPETLRSSSKLPWSAVDLQLLKRRSDFSDAFGSPPAKPLTTWQRLQNARYFHFLLPEPLSGGLEISSSRQAEHLSAQLLTPSNQDESQPLEHLVLDRTTSETILKKSRDAEIGVNEIALALLFETCSLWNQRRGIRNPKSRIRLLMPYDLRSRIDLRMPATNRLSFAFLGRTQADCQDFSTLVGSISEEIQSIKDSRLPMDFLAALEGAAKYPRAMRWAIQRSRNMATAVLTYAGDVSRGMQKHFPEQSGVRLVGNARLDKILAAPPCRDNTHISLGLCINWGQLCISAAWNRDALSRQQCQEFLQIYLSRWQTWLGLSPD